LVFLSDDLDDVLLDQVGTVAFLAYVGEDDMGLPAVQDRFQNLDADPVGHMPDRREDPFFQVPAAVAVHEHLDIVVRLDDERVDLFQDFEIMDREKTRIGDVGQSFPAGHEDISEIVGAVMGEFQGQEIQIPNPVPFVVLDEFDRAVYHSGFDRIRKGGERKTVDEESRVRLFQHRRQEADMIAVFVGDEDGVDVVQINPEIGGAPLGFKMGDAGIQKDLGVPAPDVCHVPPRAASNDAELHKSPLVLSF